MRQPGGAVDARVAQRPDSLFAEDLERGVQRPFYARPAARRRADALALPSRT
ncbi:hypothetical protein JOE62_000414 [Glutamicibacter nicotianae]|nr:hypothetical protein [Glutamicibacter nicotianae]